MSRDQLHKSFIVQFAATSRKPTVPVTEHDLHRVEEKLKITFPASFFTFLTRHGPIYTPSILELVTGGESEQAPEGASFDVMEFLAPKEIIETHHGCTEAGMEEWVIPIAMDSMGNLYGFKRELREPRPDDSPVWFFDHDFCKTHQEAIAFDTWLGSFLRMAGRQAH